MKYEIAAPVTAELNHHEHGAIRVSLLEGVHETADPVELTVIEQLLVPCGLASPVPATAAAGAGAASRASQTKSQTPEAVTTAPPAVEA